MIRRFLVDAWSRLWRGEPLDVYVGPVSPPQKALDAVAEEYARVQASAEMVAVREVPADFYMKPIKGTSFAETSEAVAAAEDLVLARLARQPAREGVSPWEAAQTVFGHSPVRRGVEWRVVCRVRG